MKIIKKMLRDFFVGIMVFALLFQSLGCSFYKVGMLSSSQKNSFLEKITWEDKKVFLHHGEEVYCLSDHAIDSLSVSGFVNPIDSGYLYETWKGKRYYKDSESTLLQEVHVYLASDYQVFSGSFSEIPFDSVADIHVVSHDAKRSVLVSFAVGAGVILILLLFGKVVLGDLPAGMF